MKIYFDKSIIGDSPRCPFLNPILGKYNKQIWGYDDDQCFERSNNGKEYLELSKDPKNCDYFVYPKDFLLDDFDNIKQYTKIAEKYGKKVIVFGIDDMDIPFNLSNAVVFRTSFSKGHKGEYGMPCFPKDLGKIEKTVRYDVNNISVSYCGYIGYDSLKTRIIYYILFVRNFIFKCTVLKRLLFNFHKHDLYFNVIFAGLGRFYRQKAHKSCLNLQKYKYDYIIRHTNTNPTDDSQKKTSYIDNILNNTFPVVIRGSGNYSFRLYEVMSLGKIPIFIDTNCELPFNNEIDYKNLFIYVPFDDIGNIEKYIDEYIKNNGKNIQERCGMIRNIYEEYLTMTGFYKHIIINLSNGIY